VTMGEFLVDGVASLDALTELLAVTRAYSPSSAQIPKCCTT